MASKFASLAARRGIIVAVIAVVASVLGIMHPGMGMWEGPG